MNGILGLYIVVLPYDKVGYIKKKWVILVVSLNDYFLFIYLFIEHFYENLRVFYFFKADRSRSPKVKVFAISCNEILQSSILPVPRMDVNEYF